MADTLFGFPVVMSDEIKTEQIEISLACGGDKFLYKPEAGRISCTHCRRAWQVEELGRWPTAVELYHAPLRAEDK